MATHKHEFRPITLTLDPTNPSVLFGCRTCIATESRCPLCTLDGNRRRHRKHHRPVVDETLLAQSKMELTKAIMQIEAVFGPLSKDRTHFG